MSVVVYDVVSSTLLVVCAAVQINDPDPELWMAVYMLGGPGLALLWRCAPSRTSSAVTVAWSVAIAAFGVHLAQQLAASFGADRGGGATSMVWQVLEHELGRELGGCGVLLVHAATLWTLHRRASVRVCSLIGVAFLVCVAGVWWLFHRELTRRFHLSAPHCSGAFSQPAVEPAL